MSTEQSRADFERAMQKRLGSLIDFTRNTHDDYIKLDAAVAWISWQASRAALVVDINPQPFYAVPCDSTPGDHYSAGVEYAKKCVSAAGITVKEG
ncbi:hypothetical protein WCT79_19045 [Pectobacterium carotovorum]|uniref:hypothetical protein n=1 Tax=Pectobacterium carotovorum TaxID=554 RepID=UPI003016BA88